MNKRIISIDVGFAITGWAVSEKDLTIANKINLIDYGAIVTSSKLEPATRLHSLHSELMTIIDKYQPEEMAVESVFFFKNQKTIIGVAQARGVILLTAAIKGLNLFDYTPLQVKTSVTGYGRADKKQVQKMIKMIFKLNEIPKPDDIADAIAVGVCHFSTARYGQLK